MIMPLAPAHVTMSGWNIIVIVKGEKKIEKFLGYSLHDNTYRISSEVLKYDAENKRGLTESGSVYEFIDAPGELHPSAQAVFDRLNAWEEVEVSLKFMGDVDEG